MRIGILGGSFDPPHLGHILIARQVREIMKLDEVWLMPYFAHSWNKTTSSAVERLKMAKLINENGVKVSEIELIRKEKSYTINTVRILKKEYSHKFYWIIGSDLLADYKKWKEHKQLTSEIEFIVVPRPGYDLQPKLPGNFMPILSSKFISLNLSSSLIRERLKKKLSIDGLVPGSILSCIKKNKLYA